LTDDELEIMRARLQKALAENKVTLLTPLPRSVRFRLWRRGRIDGLACWLVEHGHWQAAVVLWRISGSWSARR
jgi:hypothetical protein